ALRVQRQQVAAGRRDDAARDERAQQLAGGQVVAGDGPGGWVEVVKVTVLADREMVGGDAGAGADVELAQLVAGRRVELVDGAATGPVPGHVEGAVGGELDVGRISDVGRQVGAAADL